MLLWDIIRDFFVQFIFGGVDSTGTFFSGSLGQFNYINANGVEGSGYLYLDSPFIKFGEGVYLDLFDGGNQYESVILYGSMGDWLSTTFTIITLVGFCIFLYLIIRWFFRIGSGLISYR